MEGDADVYRHLRAHRVEIEQVILARLWEVADPPGPEGEERVPGLREAVAAGVAHALAGVEGSGASADAVPSALLTRARQAARCGVTLDVVLRRYIAGYTLFGDFILRAAEEEALSEGPTLRRVLGTQAGLFERLVTAVTGEYTRAYAERLPGSEWRQVERVRLLLAGDLSEAADLAYDFDDWHVGAIGRGSGAVPVLRELAQAADRCLLLVRSEGETVWAWFGGRRRVAMADLARRVSSTAPADTLVALGEPARGIDGWRLTHQQAGAAFSVSRQGAHGVVRYADVGLLASISQDQVLARSLHQLYLTPLADGRDGGAVLRATLRAYFGTGRNVSSAASVLGVSRQTVGNRLRSVEEKLGRTLESCGPEIEVALRLAGGEDLADHSNS